MLTARRVKDFAGDCGADDVGIASLDRFEGAPREMDPRFIFPAARSLIGLVFRIPRGYCRGPEEGTHFYQYPCLGYAGINEDFAPQVLYETGRYIEDHGYEAAVFRRPSSDPGTNPELTATFKFNSEPVAPDKPAPDVLMDFRQAAFLCGLGEVGRGGFFLTPEFGPLQRFAFILTDAELEPDPLYAGKICDDCEKCIAGCPGRALSGSESVTEQWGGRSVRYHRLDEWQCAAYYAGAHSATNPFLPGDAFKDRPDGDEIAAGTQRLTPAESTAVKDIAARAYGGMRDNYSACICGKSCQRECYLHLDQQGVLRKKFVHPFRPDSAWRIPAKPARDELTLAE